MAAVGDVWQLKAEQAYDVLNPILNRYFYLNTTASGTAEDCALAFIAQVLPSVVDVQFVAIVHTGIEVINLFDTAEFHKEVIAVPGTLDPTSDALPPHSTFSFIFNPDDRIVRPGRKAFSGATEVSQNNGVIDGTNALAKLEILRPILKLILKDAATTLIDRYTPIILKYIREGVSPNFTYRLPVNQAESTPVGISSVDFSANIETQNSRKLSRI